MYKLFQTQANKNPTPEMVERWQKQYGQLNILEVEGKKAYARSLTDKEMKAAVKKCWPNGQQIDKSKLVKKFFEIGFLGGDKDLLNEVKELEELIKEVWPTL